MTADKKIMYNTQTLKGNMSAINDKIQQTLKPNGGVSDQPVTDKGLNEQEILDKAKEKFFAEGGKVKKTNPASSGRKRNSSGSTRKNKGTKNATTTGGRKPILSSWKMLNIKIGQKLGWFDKPGVFCPKTVIEVLDDVTMKLKVSYGKKTTTTDGLMRAELFLRKIKKLPISINKKTGRPQADGWHKIGMEGKDGKNVTIHSIYAKTPIKTLYDRRGY